MRNIYTDSPVSIDSFTIQVPFSKTASQLIMVSWSEGISIISPGTNFFLEINIFNLIIMV
jgi:hypothetical protein